MLRYVQHHGKARRLQSLRINTPHTSELVQKDHFLDSIPLHDFIRHLPSPAVPPAWWEACAAINASGLSGLQEHLATDRCTLPDVQHSSGEQATVVWLVWSVRSHKLQEEVTRGRSLMVSVPTRQWTVPCT